MLLKYGKILGTMYYGFGSDFRRKLSDKHQMAISTTV